MRFEGGDEEPRVVEERTDSLGNEWIFYVPPAVVVLWLTVALARVVVFFVGFAATPALWDFDGPGRIVLEVVDFLGVVGGLALFVFYFLLVANKRASRWWLLGAFCFGLNLLLYLVLLALPKRAPTLAATEPPRYFPKAVRASSLLFENTFPCEQCNAVINYGVSECPVCGTQYDYEPEEPTDSGSRSR